MESPQSIVSPLKTSVYPEPEKHNLNHFAKNPNFESNKTDPFLGVLEVYIHQARDIQNICIYHKQDVYAKICLTSNPEKSVTTQTVNGGGKNPIFNQNLLINIPTIESSLKCEIYMLSRVRNYLEDQLLGFALIPLSEVINENGKLENEFTLISNDLFHSPAGFVQLSLCYNGASPDVIALPPQTVPYKAFFGECDLDKIEFPDPKIANENQIMVSEYIGLSSESSDDQAGSDTGAPFVSELSKPGLDTGAPFVSEPSKPGLDTGAPFVSEPSKPGSDTGAPFVSEPSKSSKPGSVTGVPLVSEPSKPGSDTGAPFASELSKPGSVQASVSTNGSESTNSCDTHKDLEFGSTQKDEPVEGGSTNEPVVGLTVEPELKVVQQDFVDLYMKSMQQFTESLAKMKLPLEMENDQMSSGNSGSDQSTETPKRVFYGSRAFF